MTLIEGIEVLFATTSGRHAYPPVVGDIEGTIECAALGFAPTW